MWARLVEWDCKEEMKIGRTWVGKEKVEECSSYGNLMCKGPVG